MRWMLLTLVVGLAVLGFWKWQNNPCSFLGRHYPKVVNNKIDLLCPGQSVRVSIGPDGTMTIVK